MSFQRYAEYKDSGIEWLGEVPAHWIMVPIKHVGRLKGGTGFPHEEQGAEGEELDFHKVNALASALADGTLQPSENTISKETAKRLGAFIFPETTLVFAKVGAALLLGRVRQLASPACIDNNVMGLVVAQDKHVSFVRYAMHLVRFDLIANPGAVPSLNESQIGTFLLALPPFSEQSTIAAFLNRETGKIDTLVAEQEKLIALLKEKRQAFISHAVTKGLDPTAPMKDSGIEWLGEVPEHWEVVPLKRVLAVIESGTSVNATDIPATDNEYGVLKTSCVYRGEFDIEENKSVVPEEYERVSCPLRLDAIIVSRMNTPDLVGAAGLVRKVRNGLFLPDRLWQIIFTEAQPAFVHCWTQTGSYRSQVQMACSGTRGCRQLAGAL